MSLTHTQKLIPVTVLTIGLMVPFTAIASATSAPEKGNPQARLKHSQGDAHKNEHAKKASAQTASEKAETSTGENTQRTEKPVEHRAQTGASKGETRSEAAKSDHKVGICHATGSKTNPYVYIVVDKHAADAHARHHDSRDKIGAK